MTEPGNLRIRLPQELGDRLTEWCERRGPSKQSTIERLIRWFLDQDSLLQSMVVGIVDPADQKDVAEMVLKKMIGTDTTVAHVDTEGAPEGKQPPSMKTKKR